MIHLYRY